MYVSLVVSSMWFLCLSASYLFVSSLALLLFSLPFSLPRLPAISPPHSHPHSIFLFPCPPIPSPHTHCLPRSHSHSLSLPPPPPLPFLSIFLILTALPAADDWSRFSRFALSCYLVGNVYAQSSPYSHNWHVSTHCLSHSQAHICTFLVLFCFLFLHKFSLYLLI